jgi:hypothetical protein
MKSTIPARVVKQLGYGFILSLPALAFRNLSDQPKIDALIAAGHFNGNSTI